MSARSSRLAVAMSAVALTCSLAGGAYAAGLITSADIKNDSVKGVDIKDGSLSGADVQVRVASNQVANNAVTGTTGDSVVVQTSITAPAPGYLAITASSDTYNQTDSDTLDCWIRLDGKNSGSSYRTTTLDGAAGANLEENCGTDVVLPVKKGKHTVKFMGYNGSSNTTWDESTVRAIFIPFGATGKAPSSFGVTRTQAVDRGNR